MSTFTFFTRFFVLLIISYSVVFSSDRPDDGNDADGIVRKSVPSLKLPEQSAINGFILAVGSTTVVEDAGELHRIDSAMVLAFFTRHG